MRPPPASASPMTTKFQSAGVTPALALSSNSQRSAPSAMDCSPSEVIPGGVQTMKTRIAPLKPSLRLATTVKPSTPFCTTGTFGVSISRL